MTEAVMRNVTGLPSLAPGLTTARGRLCSRVGVLQVGWSLRFGFLVFPCPP